MKCDDVKIGIKSDDHGVVGAEELHCLPQKTSSLKSSRRVIRPNRRIMIPATLASVGLFC